MRFLDIANMLIPGFEFLSDEQQSNFLNSLPGKQFSTIVSVTHDSLSQINVDNGWMNYISGKTELEKQSLEDTFIQQKNTLLDTLKDTEEYQLLVIQIACNILTKEYPDFSLLTDNQQQTLAKTDFSQQLRSQLTAIHESKQKLTNRGFFESFFISMVNDVAGEITNLDIKKMDAIHQWAQEFLESPEMVNFHMIIAMNKELTRKQKAKEKLAHLQEHATQLAISFPLLNYRKFTHEQPVIAQLRASYITENGELTTEADKVEEEQISALLLHCFRQLNQIEITFIDLEAFNKKYARQMALAIIDAVNKSSPFSFDDLFQTYEAKLHKHLVKQMQLINGKAWQIKQTGMLENLYGSLSVLWNNKALDKTEEFLDKMADAHGFIQATGFATQNENSYFAILDLYNYKRYNAQINETKSILLSLFRPLIPLYNEYKEIAFYEKNSWLKTFRMIMPMLIIAGCIILVAAALTPLALPELAFFAAFIPAFFAGLVVATKYVSLKNYLYKNIRDYYYGGSYEIPEFQINARMVSAFGDENKAQGVRAFYVDELKHCDKIESNYALKHEYGILNQTDIDCRKNNINKRHQLCLEWYDIHSNKDLSYEEAPVIALHCLQQTSENEYAKLQDKLQNELECIRKTVAIVTNDLKTNLVRHNKPPVSEGDQNKKIEATMIKTTHYQHGLFSKPQCLVHKNRLEKFDNLHEQITPATP